VMDTGYCSNKFICNKSGRSYYKLSTVGNQNDLEQLSLSDIKRINEHE
jgi:hypothetical protein